LVLPRSSNSASPYCYGYTWPDISATLWECDTVSAATKDTVLFTFIGESDSRHWTAEYNTGASTSSLGGILTGASSLDQSHSASPSASASPVAKSGKSTNVGAIVGGVVGGLAVIGATAFGVIFLLLRKRKQRTTAAGTTGNPAAPFHPNAGAGAVDASGAVGYYDHDNKPHMTPVAHPSPGTQYIGAGAGQQPQQQQQQPKYEPYSPYQDNNRVSTFSEASHRSVPPYQPPLQPAPMELDGSSAVPHYGQGGQPIYEVPAGNN
jgi:hypothetical protein